MRHHSNGLLAVSALILATAAGCTGELGGRHVETHVGLMVPAGMRAESQLGIVS